MSDGSFETLSVAMTFMPDKLTMLTESEMKLATHISSLVRKRTEQGSSPTLMLPSVTGIPLVTEKISRRLSGRLQRTSLVPSGLSASGWTGGVSQLKKELVETWPCAAQIEIKTTASGWKSRIHGLMAVGGRTRTLYHGIAD